MILARAINTRSPLSPRVPSREQTFRLVSVVSVAPIVIHGWYTVGSKQSNYQWDKWQCTQTWKFPTIDSFSKLLIYTGHQTIIIAHQDFYQLSRNFKSVRKIKR